ncbi:MAG: hypothetical protein DMG06_05550 [Acidobacteria bacterium]|nr:MAG: hypothetical protein DMG06_05550 [Acidobacteriota bacterium]
MGCFHLTLKREISLLQRKSYQRTGPIRCVLWRPWLGLFLLFPFAVAGHEAIQEQIVALTKRIEQDPTNAELYLKRGELHRVNRQWDAALGDYNRAAQIDPGLDTVDLCRGMTLLEAGRLQRARFALERFLVNHPNDVEALVARARVLVKLGEPLAAAEDFTRAVAQQPSPRPELYLERAQALVAEGGEHIDAALRGLDAGIEKLGPLVTLQLYAIDLELLRKRYDAALVRLGQIEIQSSRKEVWLAHRGEILEQAGRSGEARAAFTSALSAIEDLPEYRRKNRSMQELETRLRSELKRLSPTSQVH